MTDAGLKHPAPFKKLDEVNLIRSKVAVEGLAEIRKLLPRCRITY